jgi:hypothetical protein
MRRISPGYPMRKWLLALIPGLSLVLLAGCYIAHAQTDPASLPARDAHQGLLVTVDPYVSADRYKDKFGKHTPYEAGVAALEVYFRNDTAAPLKIDLDTIRLLIAAPGETKQKIEPLTPDYVADLVLLKDKANPRQRRLPLPLPGGAPKSGKGKEWDAFAGELRSMALSSDVLAPNGMSHGFVYFDVDRQYAWLAGARLQIPDVSSMLDHKALFFFEIDLSAAKR